MIEVITEQSVWNAAIKQVEHYDFYHTYCYHDLSRKANETPILIKYKDENSLVLLPLLVREIENTEYKDATSVYGYAGVLLLSDNKCFENESFKKELNQYFLDHKIVSVFSRLHPYLNHQEEVLNGLGYISNPGEVVYINLSEPLDIQRQRYSSRLKTHVNKASRLCTIIEGETEAHLRAFMDIYYENMSRVNANDSYFFDESYFIKLMKNQECNVDLSLAICNETQAIIAGAIFIKTDNIVQYHLSGIKEAYLDLNPIKLVIDNMRVKATKEGFKFLNLGGGRSSKQDSLFSFKSSFSKNYKPFKLWKYIINKEVYDNLTKQHLANSCDEDIEIGEFFPAYRSVMSN
ncbi:peptidoglycan bridge formation glycyltransferase FemA/FemB family protein [Winogradskyella litoriviva]|uniref:Peptidoglycan bridge formation glycyltransferase FemA/FemB family protein n=1 Tax=Winogradskyella litoriviva TaxID=1220182 RepID=A0ABX2E8M5_9FLAO|nr:peptidoglycan bridge formation glycyltransferase FemA/FemB family protein [Winogradskyella litoriviva]NRD24699.1 peptidoglycan bridge formation glycyltransferase FemA/FemB family protein [Winogradskyella litoriviva]